MESSQPIKLRIITPERTIYNEIVNHVVIPGVEGEIGVLHHHVPFMSYIKPGSIQIYHQDQGVCNANINSGLIEFKDDTLTILTTQELSKEDIIRRGEAEIEDSVEKEGPSV